MSIPNELTSIDEVYGTPSNPPYQDDEYKRNVANEDAHMPTVSDSQSGNIPMPSTHSQQSKSSRSRSTRGGKSVDSTVELMSDQHNSQTGADIPILTDSTATIHQTPIPSNKSSSVRSRSDRRSNVNPSNRASSSWQHPGTTEPIAPVLPLVSPVVSTSHASEESQAAIAYDDESDSDATLQEFQGFLRDAQIPFSEPVVPSFWDSSHSLCYLMESHPLKRSCDDDFNPGPFSEELQFELPAELGCFLVNPVAIPEGSVLVYNIAESGITTSVIEKALDA